MNLLQPIPKEWKLNADQIEQIYNIEKELAQKLINYSQKDRLKNYSNIYDEYFNSLPFHPQFQVKKNMNLITNRIAYLHNVIKPFIKKDGKFVEIGSGDCELPMFLSNLGYDTIALDVSDAVAIKTNDIPKNFKFIKFNGFDFPLNNNSIHCAFSNQLLEHLHPEDAEVQLKEIFRFLKKGGCYICITPNKHTGPHDISRFFTNDNVGFHLKEYAAIELSQLFKKMGFSQVYFYTMLKGKNIRIPSLMLFCFETIFALFSPQSRRRLIKIKLISLFTNYVTVGYK